MTCDDWVLGAHTPEHDIRLILKLEELSCDESVSEPERQSAEWREEGGGMFFEKRIKNNYW